MRLYNMVKLELKILKKNGIILLYIFLTLVYVAVIFFLPYRIINEAAAIIIFSDPVAIGFFMMGAVILMERNQNICDILCVTPLRKYEYVLGKVVSFIILGMISSLIIALCSGIGHIIAVMAGIFFSSFLYSCIGICVAIKIRSLNQFFLASVPVETILSVPAILAVTGAFPINKLLLHPAVSGIYLIYSGGKYSIYSVIVLLVWCFLTLAITVKIVHNSFEKNWGSSKIW